MYGIDEVNEYIGSLLKIEDKILINQKIKIIKKILFFKILYFLLIIININAYNASNVTLKFARKGPDKIEKGNIKNNNTKGKCIILFNFSWFVTINCFN